MDFLDYLKAELNLINAKLKSVKNQLESYSTPLMLEPSLAEHNNLLAKRDMMRGLIQQYKSVGTESFDLDVEGINIEAKVINNRYTLNRIDELTKQGV